MGDGACHRELLADLRGAMAAARGAFVALNAQMARVGPELASPAARFQSLINAAAHGDVAAADVDEARAASVVLVGEIRELARLYAVAAERADELLAAAARARAAAIK